MVPLAFLGFFGRYDQPGPGVDPGQPPKPPFLRFFQIFWRKLSKFVALNLLFLLPAGAAAALMALLYVCPAHLVLVLPGGEAPWEFDLWTWGVVPLPLVLLSPCVAGLAFVTRSFLREEPSFLWSDFWKAVRGNWKCFLGNGLVLYLVRAVLSFSTRCYQARLSQDLFSYLPFWCCVLLGVVFLWAQFYLPLLFVTFDLTFRQAYRNAFLFAALGLPRNLLLTAVFAGAALLLLALPFTGLTLAVCLVLLVTLFFSFTAYLVNFTVYPVIHRYLIQPYEKRGEGR